MTEATKSSNLFIYAASAISVVIILSILLHPKNKDNVVYSKSLMGTVVEITLMEGDRGSFDRAAEGAFSEIERLDDILSAYKADSEVSRLSRLAGGPPIGISPELAEVLSRSIVVARLSDGAFDPTVGALGGLWGYSGEKGVVPEESEVKKALRLVDWQSIIMDKQALKAGLKKKGMALNLGGVAKGYIVKMAMEALKAYGITRAIVKAGGDLVVYQKGGASRLFTIGIQHPRKPDELLGECYVSSGAVATSGDYERYFEKKNKRYHHILDPKTGWPANRSMSATIITPDATLADALSTAVFVLGPEKGMELIEELPDVQAVIVGSDGRVFTSKNFRGKIYSEVNR